MLLPADQGFLSLFNILYKPCRVHLCLCSNKFLSNITNYVPFLLFNTIIDIRMNFICVIWRLAQNESQKTLVIIRNLVVHFWSLITTHAQWPLVVAWNSLISFKYCNAYFILSHHVSFNVSRDKNSLVEEGKLSGRDIRRKGNKVVL